MWKEMMSVKKEEAIKTDHKKKGWEKKEGNIKMD